MPTILPIDKLEHLFYLFCPSLGSGLHSTNTYSTDDTILFLSLTF